ncbi:MAG: N-acyl homoserine lactonase family protein [Betaproteobacteria bacterium]|nr:N-acyl homoserine lactonase family protein [Betaproteobacteria bacterium]
MLRIRFFTCGRIGYDPCSFEPEIPRGTHVEGPIPFYLLEHPSGMALVDTGCHPDVVQSPEAAWGGLAKAFYPKVTAADLPMEQLRRAGIDPDSIPTVISTHLHMDHAGCNQFFPKARILVHALEWEAVQNPAMEGKGYFRKDWDHSLRYEQVQDGHDVFGDGSAILKHWPGHTPGHMGLVLTLAGPRTVVLAIDAAIVRANLDGAVPRNTLDKDIYRQSIAAIRAYRDAGATVIFGHDPQQFTELLAPPATW